MENNLKIVSANWKRVITKEDLIELHNIDTQLYELMKFTANVWEQGQNKKDGSTEIIQLYQAKWEFKPISAIVDVQDRLKELFKDYIAPHKPIKDVDKTDQLWLLMHSDLHRDRHQKYEKYLDSIDDRTLELAYKMKKYWAERFLYANLWDYFESDHNKKTTRWTDAQSVLSEPDRFMRWLKHQVDLIENLSSMLPTDVIIIPWNHDERTLQYLADALSLKYTNDDNVNIDRDDKPRKYYQWWDNTIWFQHGHEINKKEILNTYSQEARIRKYNYMYQWHFHHEEIQRFWPLLLETLGNQATQTDREKRKWFVHSEPIKSVMFDKKKWKSMELYK